jgi:hypothetical protein
LELELRFVFFFLLLEMALELRFEWKGKSYTATANKVKGDWWVELSTGEIYILSQDEKGWMCATLKRNLCKVIGSQLEEVIKQNPK